MLKYHAEGFKKAGGQIVAVADLAPGAAAKAAEDWDIPLSFESVEEMLERPFLMPLASSCQTSFTRLLRCSVFTRASTSFAKSHLR